ncbi:PD-(D/E)XK nuclease-like domain-containing protein [Microbacterium enclense]|uniref:PD-(D/E)XK nuclease-like domain-containing protein n=1 Tax=Microbacterium enclense TaxID=993073 RepID=UPI0021A9547A|nr:PD-(D/E)XK nuclease-like domain-containing protein [Microbacterium enclense]MCT2087336.1 PD-(D/E)XK nuclease-like domain-containing protein [Microbacterium enclense]
MTEYRGVVLGLDEETYHAHPALSSTGARQLLEAPARFEHAQSQPRAPRKAFDVGTLAHSKVLGVGAGVAVYPDGAGDHVFADPETGEEFDNVLASNGAASTKLAKSFEVWARTQGLVPLKRAEADEVNAMAEAVLSHPTARVLLEQAGHPEVSVFGTDPATGVECRARFDFLGRVGVDLKTFHGAATPVKFAKTVADHGYHVQGAHYEDTLSFIGEQIDAFAFVVVEKDPPYLVAVFVLDDDYREIGAARAKRARELFAASRESGVWPGYPSQIQIARPPQWAVYDHIDATEAER